jgi:hypothetical protein
METTLNSITESVVNVLIKFNVCATNGSSSVKPILYLLSRFLQSIVVSFRADLPDPRLKPF